MSSDGAIQGAFGPVYGRPSWKAEQGHGSFLAFEFGEPRLEISEPRELLYVISDKLRGRALQRIACVHGEWHLWIYCCAWSIRLNGKQLAQSESSRLRILRAVRVINGQALTQVSSKSNGRWLFDFDLGGSLLTWPTDEDSEQWVLYVPSGYVLTVRADGCFKHERSNANPDGAKWLPIATRQNDSP